MSDHHYTPRIFADCHGLKTGITVTTDENPFNLALHVNDNPNLVIENRRALCSSLAIPFNSYTCAEQVHEDRITLVNLSHRGAGRLKAHEAIQGTDSLITRTPRIMVNIFVADCVPIILYDPRTRSGALCHAGWRGTAQTILYKTVKEMESSFGSNAKDLRAYIGPSIGGCCYDVNENVRHGLLETFTYPLSGQNSPFIEGEDLKVDLKKANQIQLAGAGLIEKNIEVSPDCTLCTENRYFSYRKSGTSAGRYSAFLYLSDLNET